MGWRGCPTGELVFDDCRVPAANLVGGEHLGVAVLMSGLDIERAFLCLPTIGEAQRCLDLSVEYANQRVQFGKTIGEFQFVKGMLADMYAELEAARKEYKAQAALAREQLREILQALQAPPPPPPPPPPVRTPEPVVEAAVEAAEAAEGAARDEASCRHGWPSVRAGA